MRVAFVYPSTEFDHRYHAESLPVGILHLTSVLEKSGLATVDIFDDRHGMALPAVSEINSYDLIGFTSMSMQISRALDLAREVRSAGFKGPVVFGGPHASVAPDHLKSQPFIDAVFIGEAEETFPAYLKYLKGESSSPQRVWVRETNGEWRFFPGDQYVRDLDLLPFPAREKYATLVKRIRFINMTTTRGCPFQCNYCQPTKEILFGKKVRRRTVDNIMLEIKDAIESYQITGFSIDDDTFTFDRKVVLDFAQQVKTLGLHWSCQSRSDIDRETLIAMRDSGLNMLFVGVESGSQRILNLMNKKNTVEKNAEFIKICNDVGIQVWCNMMLGYPGETNEDMRLSLEFVRETRPARVCVSQVTPFPGTYLWEKHEDDVIKMDWNDFARHIQKPKFKSMIRKQSLIKYYITLMSKEFDGPLGIDLVESSKLFSFINRRFPFLLQYSRIFNMLSRKVLRYQQELNDALDSARGGRVNEGIDALEHLHRKYPSKSEILGNLGWLYLTSNQPDMARLAYQRFVQIEPRNPDGHYYLAKALFGLNDMEGARAELEEALTIAPDHENARKMIETFPSSG